MRGLKVFAKKEYVITGVFTNTIIHYTKIGRTVIKLIIAIIIFSFLNDNYLLLYYKLLVISLAPKNKIINQKKLLILEVILFN